MSRSYLYNLCTLFSVEPGIPTSLCLPVKFEDNPIRDYVQPEHKIGFLWFHSVVIIPFQNLRTARDLLELVKPSDTAFTTLTY